MNRKRQKQVKGILSFYVSFFLISNPFIIGLFLNNILTGSEYQFNKILSPPGKLKGILLKKQEMYVIITKQSAGVMELVDVLDSKSSVFGRAGSSPATGTITSPEIIMISGLFCFCYLLFVLLVHIIVLLLPRGLDSFLNCDIIRIKHPTFGYRYPVKKVFC